MLSDNQPNINQLINANISPFKRYINVVTFFLLCFLFNTPVDVTAQSINSYPEWIQFLENSYNANFREQFTDETALFLFDSTISLDSLKEQGFEVYRRLAPDLIIGKLKTNNQTQGKEGSHYGSSQFEINNLWKLSPDLLKREIYKEIINGKFWLHVSDLSAFQEFAIRNNYLKIIINRRGYFLIELKKTSLNYLLEQPFIQYVGQEAAMPKNEATVLDLNLHPNRINAVHHIYPALKGQEQILSLQEPLYDIDDIDLAGRYVESSLESEFTDVHATQMATIAVGAGNSFITGEGVAGKSLHTSSDNSNIIPDTQADYERLDVQIQNHSYGTEIESFYGASAAMYDESVNNLPELLHIMSSGNSGNQSAQAGNYASISGFANLTGNFKHAKNVLTVGSVDTTGNPILLSSKGPAHDGRVKPELTTYSMAGTSNSAALVSGTAILLQQLYKSQYNTAMPAALLKGLLINSADDVHNKGVDFSTGYGQLNALRAVENLENKQFFSDEISNNHINTLPLNIPSDVKNLKITLVWNDPAANPNDEKALVNDLDLTVVRPDSHIVMPLVLNTSPNESAITSLAIEGEDHLNNIEQVVIENPESGVYQIRVSGFDIPVENQKYYILYQWDEIDQFRWTSPTGSDNIPYNGETTSHLRWESSFYEEYGDIFYQLTQGNEAGTWKSVKDGVLLSAENYRWEAPQVNSPALLKMIIGEKEFVSDTFSISVPLRLGVGFDCTDSLKLQWPSLASADHYEIETLKDNELQTYSIVQDTSLVISTDKLESNYFRVTPIVEGKRLIQSFTINYQLQGAGCFLKTFFVEAVQDTGVFLQVELGAVNGIQNIDFEKLNENQEWKTISSNSPDKLRYSILDSNPDDGPNTYRVNIQFSNGTSLPSESLTIFFVKSRDFIVYPNPIRNNETLRVFSKKIEGDHIFQLINPLGKQILESSLTDERTFIDLPVLSDGIYYYRIFKLKEQVANGKIVIVK